MSDQINLFSGMRTVDPPGGGYTTSDMGDDNRLHSVEFFVAGRPQPAGSKRAVAAGRVVDANPRAGNWKNDVRQEAQKAFEGAEPTRRPITLLLTFFRARPQAHRDAHGRVKPAWQNAMPTAKPDSLKLARGVEDALTGIAYVDDAQVVTLRVQKVFSERPGVGIYVAWRDL